MAKIGENAIEKSLMRGAKELAQALPALPDSIRVVEEPGLIGGGSQPEPVAQSSEKQMEYEPEMER